MAFSLFQSVKIALGVLGVKCLTLVQTNEFQLCLSTTTELEKNVSAMLD